MKKALRRFARSLLEGAGYVIGEAIGRQVVARMEKRQHTRPPETPAPPETFEDPDPEKRR